MVWNFSSSGDRCERQMPSIAKAVWGKSPEANLVAPILLVVNTKAKEVSNLMVPFNNEIPCMDRVRRTLVYALQLLGSPHAHGCLSLETNKVVLSMGRRRMDADIQKDWIRARVRARSDAWMRIFKGS